MAAPLEITLSAPKPRFLVGEGIVLNVEQRVFSDLEMEDVELNRGRSRVFVTALDIGAEETVELTGDDYFRLHHVPPFQPVGSAFLAPAGSAWSNPLQLLLYSYPLAAGHYRIALTYRYGLEADEVVQTNAVEVEIVPTYLASVCDRWFGGGQARYQLGSLWTNADGRLVYQLANKIDPGALTVAVDLHVAPRDFVLPPRLAHLNDISEVQFDRWALWTEPGRVAWTKLAYIGRTGEPMAANHGLAALPSPMMADPPLQLRTGGFCAVLTGLDETGEAAASLVAVDGVGNVQQRFVRLLRPFALSGTLPGYAVFAWPASDDFSAGILYTASKGSEYIIRTDLAHPEAPGQLELPGRLIALVADQWNGSGSVLAAAVREDVVRVMAWDFSTHSGEGALRSSFDLGLSPSAADKVIDAVALDGGRELALLLPEKNDWLVLVESHEFWVGNVSGADGSPRLAAGPGGLFLVFHVPERGFVFRRVGEAPPPSGI